MIDELDIRPACPDWRARLDVRPDGILLGHPQADWRAKTRRELGLDAERPLVATGHQSLLWHPGILAKYLVVDAFANARDLASANLVVDQHAGVFGDLDVPVRRAGDRLAVRTLALAAHREGVPMGRHAAFTPPRPPAALGAALPSVERGVTRIFEAVYAHRDAPNAALQMADALADLMAPWVGPRPNVTATDLMETALARALLEAMRDDPVRCAEAYNRAVAAVPEAGIGPLLVRDDYIEMPLWRLRDDGRRMHAYDSDVERALDEADAPVLLPRALFMTALVRLGMADLFVHGTGGARYDRAMEVWIRDWLGVEVSPIAVATATLRLPLGPGPEERPDLDAARAVARRAWHDPESAAGAARPGPDKRAALAEIDALPRRSPERRAAFFALHDRLADVRRVYAAPVEAARAAAESARRAAEAGPIIDRRTWAFPLYDQTQIDALAAACAERVECGVN